MTLGGSNPNYLNISGHMPFNEIEIIVNVKLVSVCLYLFLVFNIGKVGSRFTFHYSAHYSINDVY